MTKEDFDSKYSPIVMPEPFAESGDKVLPTNTQDNVDQFNFPKGWQGSYSSPNSNNGKFVTRQQMNAIGNLATHNDFYRRCGGINTFDPAFAALIGGYPKGAVLEYVNDGQIYYVISLKDDNTVDFRVNIDDVNWTLLNYQKPSEFVGVPFFESGNLSASSSFVIATETAKFNASILVYENLELGVLSSGSIEVDFSVDDIRWRYEIGSGIMIKDITNGDDGLYPTYSDSGVASQINLIPNGWSTLVGDPGFIAASNGVYTYSHFAPFTGSLEQGHKYKLMIFCGYAFSVNLNSTLTLYPRTLTGKLKLYYNV